MRYSLTFNDREGYSLTGSIYTFLGEELNVKEMKDSINKNFIRNKNCSTVDIQLFGDGITANFIGGWRETTPVFINKNTKEEYSPKEFSEALNTLELKVITQYLETEYPTYEKEEEEC